MVAATIIRSFGHTLLSRLFSWQRTTGDHRKTGARCRAWRCLVDRRFHNPAEQLCASACQIVAADDVHLLSSGRWNCRDRTCRSDSIFAQTRVYPRFGKCIARKDAEIRRVYRCDQSRTPASPIGRREDITVSKSDPLIRRRSAGLIRRPGGSSRMIEPAPFEQWFDVRIASDEILK